MPEVRKVRLTLTVEGLSDRDPSEWGYFLARYLQNELNDGDDLAAFGPIEVRCTDTEVVRE